MTKWSLKVNIHRCHQMITYLLQYQNNLTIKIILLLNASYSHVNDACWNNPVIKKLNNITNQVFQASQESLYVSKLYKYFFLQFTHRTIHLFISELEMVLSYSSTTIMDTCKVKHIGKLSTAKQIQKQLCIYQYFDQKLFMVCLLKLQVQLYWLLLKCVVSELKWCWIYEPT